MVGGQVTSAAQPAHVSQRTGKQKAGPGDENGTVALLRKALYEECKFERRYCDVEVKDHVANIMGNVESITQKRQITRAAMHVRAVSAINNNLRIAPLSHHSDPHMAAEVRAALRKAGLSSSMPRVGVVDSVVCLSGIVRSPTDQKIAEEAARQVPGVEFVVNDTRSAVVPPCPQRIRNKAKLLRDVEFALERSLGNEAKNVKVSLRRGMVYMRGNVGSERRRFLAEDAVRWVPCVVDVVNELAVTSRLPN